METLLLSVYILTLVIDETVNNEFYLINIFDLLQQNL